MQLYNFIIQLIHYYPPELVSLYLLLGLGVTMAKYSSIKTEASFVGIFIGIPIGIMLGLLVIALFPVYVASAIFKKLTE